MVVWQIAFCEVFVRQGVSQDLVRQTQSSNLNDDVNAEMIETLCEAASGQTNSKLQMSSQLITEPISSFHSRIRAACASPGVCRAVSPAFSAGFDLSGLFLLLSLLCSLLSTSCSHSFIQLVFSLPCCFFLRSSTQSWTCLCAQMLQRTWEMSGR